MFQLLKLSMVVFYVLVPVSFFVAPLQPYSQVFIIILGVLAATHLGEYLLVRDRLSKINNGSNHFVQTMLFGFMYWVPLFKKEKV